MLQEQVQRLGQMLKRQQLHVPHMQAAEKHNSQQQPGYALIGMIAADSAVRLAVWWSAKVLYSTCSCRVWYAVALDERKIDVW